MRMYSRDTSEFFKRNITHLGVRDFYTIVTIDGELDSRMEDMLSHIEGQAAAIFKGLLSSLNPLRVLSEQQATDLAVFICFQMVRGPRHRHELEVMAGWYAKRQLSGQVEDKQLRQMMLRPHPNEHIALMGRLAEALFEFVFPRPVAVVFVEGARLFTSDEPVIVNTGGDHVRHHPDCSLTQADIDKRLARERHKKAKRRKDVRRVVHFAPTQPRGVQDAIELVLPISPTAALVYGSISEWDRNIVVAHLNGEEAQEFAQRVNSAMCSWALDAVIAHPDDKQFVTTPMPPVQPLMRVCDGTNAAADSVNQVPIPLRPVRLWRHA